MKPTETANLETIKLLKDRCFADFVRQYEELCRRELALTKPRPVKAGAVYRIENKWAERRTK